MGTTFKSWIWQHAPVIPTPKTGGSGVQGCPRLCEPLSQHREIRQCCQATLQLCDCEMLTHSAGIGCTDLLQHCVDISLVFCKPYFSTCLKSLSIFMSWPLVEDMFSLLRGESSSQVETPRPHVCH